jgi:dTDP-4-amino-4,6-dideoxygalactose transaminase
VTTHSGPSARSLPFQMMTATSLRVPLLDLQAQYRSLKPRIDAAVIRVLESGRYVLGPEVAAFEEEFAAFCGTRHAIGVNTGTSALHLALLACEIGEGDEVITVPFTFVATVAAIQYTGARPVLVDVEPGTLNMDPALIEAAITPRTRAIVPVHLHGQPADMERIRRLADRYGVTVIEDAAQAHGAEVGGRRVGSLGSMGCFSFYPGKNLGAAGEGGAITTDDEALAARVRLLRDWGAEQKYHHVLRGFNYRLEEIQAAILRVKLAELERWTDARRTHAARYRELLADAAVEQPREAAERRHVYHVFAIRHGQRDALAAELADCGVGTGIHYPVPVHLQPGYADLGYGPGDFPVSERAANEILSLPMYPELRPDQLEAVASAVERAASS